MSRLIASVVMLTFIGTCFAQSAASTFQKTTGLSGMLFQFSSSPEILFADGFEMAPPAICGSCITVDDCLEPTDQCLELDGGLYCSQDCSEGNPYGTPPYECPSGYSCQNVLDGFQCIPESNSCTCLSSNVQETRPCSISNAYGMCEGVETCEPAGWSFCSAEEPSHEICDYADNDCNGEVDEVFRAPDTGNYVDDHHCGACGIECAGALRNATSSCFDAAPSPYCGILECDPNWYDVNLAPQDGCECFGPGEICDGQDNDCDGQIDNDLDPESCSLQMGVCAGSVKQCGGAAGYFDCSFAQYGPDYEVTELSCDGIDNDCDGETDEQFGMGESCGLGACAGGELICSNDGGVECSTQLLATSETCNGVDDDCDGIIDEGC